MAQWDVPLIAQTTAKMCWEACARMMWQWRNKSLTGYFAKAGAYAEKNTGLTQLQMTEFYKLLGMRTFANATGANLRHAVRFSPVVFTYVGQVTGHAMVLLRYESEKYTIANPCAVNTIDFETEGNDCAAGKLVSTKADVDRPLGKHIWYW